MVSALETSIIRNCSATLAGLKTASIFNVRGYKKDDLDRCITIVNSKLNSKGVFVTLVAERPAFFLVYVYRQSFLVKDLLRKGVMEILEPFGYKDNSLEMALEHLKVRLATSKCFPHEIGLFLGYPVADVAGFIENKGESCKCCGFWKVYDNREKAVETFCKYHICMRIYKRAVEKGLDVASITVAA